MYCGSIKLKCHLFLKEFSDELKMLTSSPFVVNDKSYMVQIYAFICDAPARSLLKGIVNHTGYHSCERCTIVGRCILNRIVFAHIEVNVDLRTNIEFLDYTYANRDHNGRCHQHEKSIFSEINSLDFINMFTLDYMHLVCLGATRRILYFFKGGIKGTNHGKISLNMLDQISNSLLQLNGKLPSDFARQPMSLSDLDRWKATELRSFLVYYGMTVLKDIIDLRTYKHFLSLSISIRILCDSNAEFRRSNLEIARRLIKYFVINSTETFGQLFCFYSIHSLLHICDDVAFYNAPLDSLSAFPFENFLQKIKRLVRSKHNPISQICKRLDEINFFNRFEQKKTKINTNLRDGCFLTKHGVVFIKVNLGNDQYSCFYYRKDCLDNYFTHFLNSKDIDVYFLRSNVRHVVRVKHKDSLVNKCVCLPI
ncbi:uncharacterized protein LOC136090245 [Hydra vulgaris]|uniref:Uncharacterized protein LOC136090245 n=1 Tax=Hydra vulgaris TaxID=6087 RepID=A0ABM4DDR8_HYDVU